MREKTPDPQRVLVQGNNREAPEKPLVTIVTPSYNQGAYIEETIRSVLGQTYPHIEYVVVDGGSRDGSVDVIRRYESRLAYWCSEADSGQSEATNKGFRMARGKLVGWLNSDDYLEPDAIERLVRVHEQHPQSVLLHGRLRMVDHAGQHVRYAKDHRRPLTFARLLDGMDQLSQPGSLYRRDAVEKVGYLDPELKLVMDYELWLRLLRIGEATYIPAVLGNYRAHEGTKTATQVRTALKEMKIVRRKYGGSSLSARNIGLFVAGLGLSRA
jgi:GT2 family glycosyltransferase